MKTYQQKFGVHWKVVFIAVSLLLTSLSTIAVVAYNQAVEPLVMTYSFSVPTLSKVSINNKVYDQITLTDAPCSGDPGEPNLPTKGAYLLLPPNTKVDSIMATGKKTMVGTGFIIAPCGTPIPLTGRAATPVLTQDASIYSSDTPFPGSLYTMVGVYQFRGYSILVLMLHPVQYIPLTGELYYYPSLDITVTLTSESKENLLYRGTSQDYTEVVQKIDNPEAVGTYQALSPRTVMTDSYDLLILTTDALKTGFIPLATKHNQSGTTAIIKTLTDVGGSTPENIRDYIRTAYITWGISYVLLGGDADVIPAKILWVEGMDENVTPYETDMPVDLYYGCLDGPYNYDGDDRWGEPNDGEGGGDVDLIAEVYIGRACAGDSTEVNNFVSKTVEYLSVPVGETYLGKATFAGEYLGDYGIASFGGTTLDQLVNGSSENGFTTVGIPASIYTIDRLHDEDYPGFNPDAPWGTGWPVEEIISRINQGVHFINHDGHANYVYNMRMNIGDVTALTNTDKFCFVYSQGCMSGGFDNPEGSDCIAEYFTAKTSHGAFAGIWNARYGYFWSYSTDGDSQRFHRQFWDAVFGENIREIGRANHDSKEDNLFLIQRSCMRWCYYETNLFGDPAVHFQNASETKPQLTINSVTGGKGVVVATILNGGEVPVTDILWSITIQGGVFGFINISSEGIIDSLLVGNTTIIQQDKPIFGLGKISISVNVDYAEPWNGQGFVLGPFVLKVIRIC